MARLKKLGIKTNQLGIKTNTAIFLPEKGLWYIQTFKELAKFDFLLYSE